MRIVRSCLYKKVLYSAAGLFLVSSIQAQETTAQTMDHSQHQMDHSSHQGHGAMQTAESAGMHQHVHHAHGAGAWMFEYRYMHMDMDGLLDGDDSVTTNQVINDFGYLMSPQNMTMDMHMFMIMYGVSENFTLMAMFHYLENEMDMITGDGTESTMSTSGVGDTILTAMYQINREITLSAGVNIPTGSIDERVTMLMNGGMPHTMNAPYRMQLGSGTYDFIPSITYQTRMHDVDWGGQFSYVMHTGENDNGYTLGDKLEISGWGKFKLGATSTLSFGVDYMQWGDVEGRDPAIMAAMSPSADPGAQGGTRTDLSIGVSYSLGMNNAVGGEFAFPMMQDLDGPQMETKKILSLFWQYTM